MSVVGFDFGTQSSVVAVAQRGGIDVLMNEVSSRANASLVGFGEKQRFTGEAAASQQQSNLKNTVASVKRLLGRSWSDPAFQAEKSFWPSNALVELPGDRVGVQVMYKNEQITLTPEQLAAMILTKLKENAEKNTKSKVVEAVLSVPGFWNDTQRRALHDAAKVANLNVVRLINDLTAVAITYGLYKTNLPELDSTAPHKVMFIDMGDSHFSASIVHFWNGKLKVVASAHDATMGGRNFDLALANFFADDFKAKHKLDIRTNPKAWFRLIQACNKLKTTLNINPQVALNVECLMNDYDLNSMVTRDQYASMIKDVLDKVVDPVKECLAQAGSDGTDLAAVEIVGSGMRSMLVQQTIAAFLKRDLSTTMNAEEAIAKGCALQAAMLSPKFRVKEYSVLDVQPYSISVYWRTIDDPADTKENSVELFKARSALPAPKHVTFNRPDSKPFQVQARYTAGSTDQSPSAPQTNPLIGTFTVRSIPKPKLPNEVPEVRVKVVLNADGIVVAESAEFADKYEEEEAADSQPKADTATPTPTPAPAAAAAAPTGGDKMDTDPTAPTAAAAGSEQPAPAEPAPKKIKKKVRYVPIPVDVKYTAGLSDSEIKDFAKLEEALQADVAAAVAVQDARNALEAYIFKSRDKLHDVWSEFVLAKDRDAFSLQLEDAENWVYDEGDYQTKETFEKKLLELKAVGEPIAARLYEAENRPKAVSTLRQTIESLEGKATQPLAEYDHIDAAEKQKIVDELNKTRKWLDETLAKQTSLAKTDDPVLFTRDILLKHETLQAFASPILNKPKPQPKPEEAKSGESKPASTAQEPDASSAAPQNGDAMDVDQNSKDEKPAQTDTKMDVDP